jgi:hypothetical protein
MKDPIWRGQVDIDGVLHMETAKLFKAYIAKTMKNCAVEIVVRKFHRKASRKQHGWYRGYALPAIAEEMGHLPNEYPAVHDALMRELIGLKEGCDPRLQIRASTADMNTVEFTEQMKENLQIWAATTLGLVLHDPDANWKLNKQRRAA